MNAPLVSFEYGNYQVGSGRGQNLEELAPAPSLGLRPWGPLREQSIIEKRCVIRGWCQWSGDFFLVDVLPGNGFIFFEEASW